MNPAYTKNTEIWNRLPGFDVRAAMEGKPYIHRFNVLNKKTHNVCRRIEGAHAATLIWAGEWLTYLDDSEQDNMYRDFRMFNAAAYRGVAA